MGVIEKSAEGYTVGELHGLYLHHESSGRHQEGRPILARAIELGRSDPVESPALARAKLSWARDQLRLAEVERGFAICDSVRTAAGTAGDAALLLMAIETKATMLASMGRFQDVLRISRASLVTIQVHAARDAATAAALLVVVGEAHLASGDTSTAEAFAEMASEIGASDLSPTFTMLRTRIDIAGGRLRDAHRRVEGLLARRAPELSPEASASLRALKVEASLWSGNIEQAEADVDLMLAALSIAEDRTQAAVCLSRAARTSAELYRAGIAAGDPKMCYRARRHIDEVRRSADELASIETNMHAGSRLVEAETADRHAEQSRTDSALANTWWSAAAEQWTHIGHPHRAGYAHLRKAEHLHEQGDRATSADSLLTAWQLSPGHKPLRREIVGLAHTTHLVLPEDIDSTSLLSPRELEVMRHVATGMKTDAIGRILEISPRTAQKHLENAYRKLNCHDRVVAVQQLSRTGLLG